MTFARLLAAAALCAVASAPALADGYPSKPITLIVGSSPGSTTDGLARAIGQEITAQTKVPVIVDNKAGAAGGIAAQAVARAPADGYTLFITTNTTQAANPHLFRKLAYDPVRGWGFEVLYPDPNTSPFGSRNGSGAYGPFDDSPNGRDEFDDTCPDEIYDSFIGFKNFTNECSAATIPPTWSRWPISPRCPPRRRPAARSRRTPC